jgi:gas vesicle protein
MNYTEEDKLHKEKITSIRNWITFGCSIAILLSVSGIGTYLCIKQSQNQTEINNDFSIVYNKIDDLSNSITSQLINLKTSVNNNTYSINQLSDKIDTAIITIKDYKNQIDSKINDLKASIENNTNEIKNLEAQSDAHAAEAKALLESIKTQNSTDTTELQNQIQAIIDLLTTRTYMFAGSKDASITVGQYVTYSCLKEWDCDHQNDGYIYADTNRNEKWDEGDYRYSKYITWNNDNTLPKQEKYFGYLLNQMLDTYPSGNVVITDGKMSGIVMPVGNVLPHGDSKAKFTYTVTIQDGLADYIKFKNSDNTTIAGTWQNGEVLSIPDCIFKTNMVPQTSSAYDTMIKTCEGKSITFDFE